MREVMYSKCAVCHVVIGCFDSARVEQRQDCNTCTYGCPEPTTGDSHGFCEFHLQMALKRRRVTDKKLTEV